MLANRLNRCIVSQEHLSDGRVVYVAVDADLDGCMADGLSADEAIANLNDARVDFIYFLLEDGLPVPYDENA